jgi:uncharacterized protein YndB with AHSA1/START domain
VSTTLSTADGRSVLRMERRLRRPPQEVWPALVEPERLATWFPSEATIEQRVGGKVVFGFGGDGTVTDLDPPRLIAFTWETDHLRFELTPDGDGTLLVLVHTFDDRAGAASFASGWDGCLDALDGRPEGDHEARHERYLVDLGLLEPEVVDASRVRLERQLLHPADRVWPALLAVTGGLPVREVREAELLEVELPPGRERWELRAGTGHGARLVLVRPGPPEALTARVAELLAAVGGGA